MPQARSGRYDSCELALLRATTTITVLTRPAAAFASCGSGDNSSTTAVTALATPSSASGSPASSATGTAAQSSTRTEMPMPAPVPGNWTVSGQVVGSALVGASGCQTSAVKFDIQLKGTLNGTAIDMLISSAPSGRSTSASRHRRRWPCKYGAAGSAVNDYWFGTSGDAGMSGTPMIDATGSGSANLTVPPSVVSPGGATQAIGGSGLWTCQ